MHFVKMFSQSRYKKITLFLLFNLLMSVKGTTCLAQSSVPGKDEEIHYRQQQQIQEQKRREQQKDVFLQGKTKEDNNFSLPKENNAFLIKKIQLEGVASDQFPWASEQVNHYANRLIGTEGIKLIVKRLLNSFIVRGYATTRISIPEQDISTGMLKLTIIPGRVGKVKIIGDKKDNWQTAFPIALGNILNIRDLEQGLEQMRRLPSQEVNLQIVPGEKLGDSDILLKVQHGNNLRGLITLDDSGQSETGKLQSYTTVNLDNMLHLNDMLEVSFFHDLDGKDTEKGTNGSSFDYSFPYGNWTFGVNKNFYNYHENVQSNLKSMQYSGKIDALKFRAQRLIHRDRRSKTNVQLDILKQCRTNYLNDTEIVVQRKEVTAAELGLSYRQYFGNSILDTTLSCRLGRNEHDAATGIPAAHYKVWTLNTQYWTKVQIGKVSGWYSCNIRAQYSKNSLDASDFFNIGSRYTVRGFDGQQLLSAENGWYVRNEISMPVKNTEAYVGLDFGQVSGSSAAVLTGKKLIGAVLGFRGQLKNTRYDIFAGSPLYKPCMYHTAKVCCGFQLSYLM